MKSKRIAFLLLAGLVASSAVPALAERARDGDDARGPFDLASLIQPKRDGDRLLFVLTTHEGWTVDQVRSGGFAIRVDSDKDDDFDRFVLVEWTDGSGPGGKLRARVVLPTGETIATAAARHPKPRRLKVWLNRKTLGIRPGAFHIDAYSVYYRDWCPEDGCRDYIPNGGRLKVAYGGLCAGREPDIVGTTGDDKIRTRGTRVVVVGLSGDDVITVERGSAIVCGGKGRDVLTGGRWADLMAAGGGDDYISLGATGKRPDQGFGGPGNDLLYGGRGPDRLWGQADDDYLAGRAGSDYLDGGRGNDDLSGGRGSDTCINGRDAGGC